MNEDLEFIESEFLADQEDLETIYLLEDLEEEGEKEGMNKKNCDKCIHAEVCFILRLPLNSRFRARAIETCKHFKPK